MRTESGNPTTTKNSICSVTGERAWRGSHRLSVLSSTPGRLRLALGRVCESQGKVLESALRQRHGIRRARCNALTGNLVVEYCPSMIDEAAIMRKAAVKLQEIVSREETFAPSSNRQKMRISVPGLQDNPGLAHRLEQALSENWGLRVTARLASGRLQVDLGDAKISREEVSRRALSIARIYNSKDCASGAKELQRLSAINGGSLFPAGVPKSIRVFEPMWAEDKSMRSRGSEELLINFAPDVVQNLLGMGLVALTGPVGVGFTILAEISLLGFVLDRHWSGRDRRSPDLSSVMTPRPWNGAGSLVALAAWGAATLVLSGSVARTCEVLLDLANLSS